MRKPPARSLTAWAAVAPPRSRSTSTSAKTPSAPEGGAVDGSGQATAKRPSGDSVSRLYWRLSGTRVTFEGSVRLSMTESEASSKDKTSAASSPGSATSASGRGPTAIASMSRDTGSMRATDAAVGLSAYT